VNPTISAQPLLSWMKIGWSQSGQSGGVTVSPD
jgi:hypothetical protein